MLGKKLIKAASGSGGGGGGGGAGLGIEDVFSTWLYTGNGSTQTITNGIDLAGEGGMVWIKGRSGNSGSQWHAVGDTERGGSSRVFTNVSDANDGFGNLSFLSSGFTLTNGNAVTNDGTTTAYASWTFRKAPGFFDVVTYTGNGTSGRTIAHGLGSVPGTVIIKCTSAADDWWVWHRSVSTGNLSGNSLLKLNSHDFAVSRTYIGIVNSSTFEVGSDSAVNGNGGTYVAYLFAHDEQIFGENEDQSVIKCGSYTGNGSATGPVIDLGWEPQWLLIKRTDAFGQNWVTFDTMRGVVVGATGDKVLYPNTSDAEINGIALSINSQGFQLNTSAQYLNTSGGTYIYIAIRRGPMKTPTSGTEVFSAVAATLPSSVTAGFPVDMTYSARRSGGSVQFFFSSRLTGDGALISQSTAAESAEPYNKKDNNYGLTATTLHGSDPAIWHMYRRAPGFFDVVAYTGNSVSNRAIAHGLGVAPQMIIVKGRNFSGCPGYVQVTPFNPFRTLELNSNIPSQNNKFGTTAPNATNFYVSSNNDINETGRTYIAYLFATLDGVSKVGSYTGTGTTLSIDCGFSSGARFVLIKRAEEDFGTGDWYVWDTARGIVSGNDPYLLLNSTAAEVTSTDYIDPLSSGFQISSTAPAAINASGGSYIFLAIA